MFATIRKEFLLLLRDPGGILLLLLMPTALIIVMALVQDAPFRDYQEMKFDILVANNDKGPVGRKIVEGLASNRSFVLHEEEAGNKLSTQTLKDLLQEGTYKIGIVIPENASKALISVSNHMANQLAGSMGLPGALQEVPLDDSADIQLLFDPVTKPSFRSSLNFALNQYVLQVKMDLLLSRMSKMSHTDTSRQVKLSMASFNVLDVRERSLGDDSRISPRLNSVQHNVPAYALFGMFLIVVPIAGNMIRESDEGSAVRIRLIPNAMGTVALGKILFYILVCLTQFLVMLQVGIYLLPLFGLSSLQTGSQPLALVPVAICIAFAAVSFGYFIGAIFKTANQAMPFGAITVVLFSAMGGIWVPVEVLPDSMQAIARFSPMYWSLEGVNQVILRDNGWQGIGLPCSVLALLGLVLTLIAILLQRRTTG